MAKQRYGSTPEQQAVIDRIIEERVMDDATARQTAEALNVDGIPAPNGKEWTQRAIAGIFERPEVIEVLDRRMQEECDRVNNSGNGTDLPTWDELDEQELQQFGYVTYRHEVYDTDSKDWKMVEHTFSREDLERQATERAARMLLEQKAKDEAVGTLRWHRFKELSTYERLQPGRYEDAPGLTGYCTKLDGGGVHALLDRVKTGNEVQQWWKRDLRKGVNILLNEIAASRQEILHLKQEIEQLKLKGEK